jgi:hypothetical protein
VFSEIAWAGSAAAETHTWIELRNLESAPIDLTGWTLRWRPILSISPEDRAWRTIALSGVVTDYQPNETLRFDPDAAVDNAWWVRWPEAVTSDHYVIWLGEESALAPEFADLLWPAQDEFGLSSRLPVKGALFELSSPSGCMADTANAEWLPGAGWSAGSVHPPASMERTDVFAEDVHENWHTNLGMVRVGFDAFGNLLHGTPKCANSPILSRSAETAGLVPTIHAAGDPLVASFEMRPLWPAVPELWHVIVTQDDDAVLSVDWTVALRDNGSTVVTLQTMGLPLNTPLGLWIRTPTGEVRFTPFLLME